MKLERYSDPQIFTADVLDILLRDEVLNNLPIAILGGASDADTSPWLMAAVKDDAGSVLLTALCTPPFNVLLYATNPALDVAALQLLANELKSTGYALPGVLAEQSLAHRFAHAYTGNAAIKPLNSMHIMRLDRLNDTRPTPGHCRPLREEDLFFAPYWDRAMEEDCGIQTFDLPHHIQSVKGHIGNDTYYIWEDNVPVSQAVHGRSTANGAVVNAVYTPPHYRGLGYATANVAALSRMLLDKGHKFCCLFADAENPISCGIYRKIGYKNLCLFDEIKF